MTLDKRALLCAATFAAIGLNTGVAQAQASANAAPTRDSNTTTIEEVVVQARRVEESQQDVPIAITTVTPDVMTAASVSSVADIQRLAPALQITQGPTAALDYTIRGSFAGFGVDPAVITYVDEVPTDPKLTTYGLFDLGSVEVLKGPQGTLFGRNSTGGAVLFVSNRPSTGGSGGYVSARYGNLDERRFEGAFNAPLSETLAVRLAGQFERRGGTLESVTLPGREYDNRDNSAIRVSVAWTPTDAIENLTHFNHYRVSEHRTPQVILSLAGPCTGPTTPAVSCLFQPPFNSFVGTDDLRAFATQTFALAGTNKTVNNDPVTDLARSDSVTNALTVDLGAVTVKNISFVGDSRLGLSRDFDGSPARVIEAFRTDDTRTYYSETQVFGTLFNERLDWRLGGVYSRDDATSDATQSVVPLPVSTTTPRRTLTDTRFVSKALFGQLTYDLSELVEGLSVTAGYRYTWDDRKVAMQAFAGAPTQQCALQTLPVPVAGPSPFPGADLATCTRRLKVRYGDDNYSFTVDWRPTDQILVYATTRKGYKTGSFNLTVIDPVIAQYAPEVVKDAELGIKADWRLGSMPVRANIAVFKAEYTNIQSTFTVSDLASGSVQNVTLNRDPVSGLSSKATIKGFEAELTALPTSWLQLTSFYSHLDTNYTQFFTVTPRLDLAGENIAGVYPETFGTSAQVTIPLSGPVESVRLNGSYFWRAAALRNAASSVTQPRGESYSSIDLRLTLTNLFDTGADIAVYGKNLEGSREKFSQNILPGLLTNRTSEGKTYGVELRYRFGAERP